MGDNWSYILRCWIGGWLLLSLGVCYGQTETQLYTMRPGETVPLRVTAAGATSYVWLRGNTLIEGAEQALYLASQPGVYSAIAYNDFECQSVTSNLIELVLVSDPEPEEGVRVLHYCLFQQPKVGDLETKVSGLIWYADAQLNRPLSLEIPLEEMVYYGLSDGDGKVYRYQVQLDACLDLALEMEVDQAEVAVGSQVRFQTRLRNISTIQGGAIEIDQPLPNGFTYIDHQASQGQYSEVSGVWGLKELLPDTEETLVIRARVEAEGAYEYVAFLRSSTPEDFNTENNGASVLATPILLKVYNMITPNGDGFNDYFTIEGIEAFPQNALKVYNRDGVQVYSQSPYDNRWDGVSNANWVLGKGTFPAGVYYYILDLGPGVKAKTGWLYINY